MANELDELTGPVNELGRDVHVINRQILVQIGVETLIFEVAVWICPPLLVLLLLSMGLLSGKFGILYIIASSSPGVIFSIMKINALSYLRKLQQKIQADASQIDAYLEQRVMILRNVAGLLEKAVDLDKDIMKTVSAYRSSSGAAGDLQRNAASSQIDGLFSRLGIAVEAYPELRAHAAIAEAMQQNFYLQQEITAARTLYNDTVAQWNQDIFAWPTKQIVAARNRFTTRIPFIASSDIKTAAAGTFF